MGLEAKDLRISNLLLNKKGETIEVSELDSEGVNGFHDEGIGGYNYFEFGGRYDEIKPILLTEEWLIKFGFEKKEKPFFNIDCYEFDLEQGFLDDGNGIINKNNPIKFVHSLQNLYFALTGEELTIKL